MRPALFEILFGGKKGPINPVQTNIAAWFKYGVGITSSGGFVSQWDDQSGNARHLKQGTAPWQPPVQGDGSVLFDGVSAFLQTDAFTLNQPTTFYILGRQITWGAGLRWCDGVTGDAGTLQEITASPQVRLFSGSGLATISPPLNTYCVVSAVCNGAASSLQLNNNPAITGDAGASNMGGFALGSGANGSHCGNIQAKEAIIYPVAHDATTRAQVVNYLMALGGVLLWLLSSAAWSDAGFWTDLSFWQG
jgi:hypothetical protein